MPDYQCSWWPDTWFGISITDCCIAHDLGGSLFSLGICVGQKAPILMPVGAVMIIGVAVFGPVYQLWKRSKR